MAIARHLEIAAQLLQEPNVPPSDRLPYSPEFDAFCLRFCRPPGLRNLVTGRLEGHSWCTQAWACRVVAASPSYGPGVGSPCGRRSVSVAEFLRGFDPPLSNSLRTNAPMGIQLSVWGDYACFSRSEMKVERVSYDVLTPSAARGSSKRSTGSRRFAGESRGFTSSIRSGSRRFGAMKSAARYRRGPSRRL